MSWPNFAPQAFEKFKEIYKQGGSAFISVPTTEMAKGIPKDWWGRYTNPSERIEARVYARVVVYSTHLSEDRMKVDSFDAGQAVLTHYSKPGIRWPAKFEPNLDAEGAQPTVKIGDKKQMTRVEAYEDGEAPSDLSMIPIIMVVMVMVALAFTFK